MAELSTLARPYATALFEAARPGGSAASWLALVEELAHVTSHPQVAAVIADPKVGDAQTFTLISGLMTTKLPAELTQFLRLLIENQRIVALPEVSRQFRNMKNASEGAADCLIETAFALIDAQVADLVTAMSKKFGLKLKPEVRVDVGLIGGVRVTVGDHVLDTSVKSRLAQMHVMLSAA